jgi:hypothetical protein
MLIQLREAGRLALDESPCEDKVDADRYRKDEDFEGIRGIAV